MTHKTWDWVAEEVLDATGLKPQPDAAALAGLLGLELWPQRRCDALLEGSRVYYDETAPVPRQQEMISRCVARWGLAWCDVEATDAAIAHVTHAITGRQLPSFSEETSVGVVVPFPAGGRRVAPLVRRLPR
jgi:hypothetical protein